MECFLQCYTSITLLECFAFILHAVFMAIDTNSTD